MPPKGTKKAKSKAKGKAKAKAVSTPAALDAASEAIVLAAQPKSMAGKMKRQLKDALLLRSFSDVVTEQKDRLAGVDAQIEEAAALEAAHAEQADAAQKELDVAKKHVEAAMEEEMRAMSSFRATGTKKRQAEQKIQDRRASLIEAQKKLTMVNLMAATYKSRQMAEEAKQRAAQAAAEAKQALMAQRDREKETLEATRKALADARSKRLAAAGLKPTESLKRPRISGVEDPSVVADTLVHGEDIE